MTHYVRVVDGEVKDVWDTPPSEGVGNNGWRNAVEVRPDIVQHRQAYTAHRFDLNVDPVQIIWGVYDISIDDRKRGMKANVSSVFRMNVNQQLLTPETADPALIDSLRQAMLTKHAAIDAATTHDELDALM